jgi:D-alanyl-D-alanine carboxypeptidase
MPILKKTSLILAAFFLLLPGLGKFLNMTVDSYSLLTPVQANAASTSETLHKKMNRQIGPKDAAILSDPAGNILFGKNENLPLIPASTLKILTALFALDHLGEDFRFKTQFFKDDLGNLKIKGFGEIPEYDR